MFATIMFMICCTYSTDVRLWPLEHLTDLSMSRKRLTLIQHGKIWNLEHEGFRFHAWARRVAFGLQMDICSEVTFANS